MEYELDVIVSAFSQERGKENARSLTPKLNTGFEL